MPEMRKALNHPLVGRLILEHITFHVSHSPNLQLILRLPVEEETGQKLQRHLASGCSHCANHCLVSLHETLLPGKDGDLGPVGQV